MTVPSQNSASVRRAKPGLDRSVRLVIPSVVLTGLLLALLVRAMAILPNVHVVAAQGLPLLGVTLLPIAVVIAFAARDALDPARAK